MKTLALLALFGLALFSSPPAVIADPQPDFSIADVNSRSPRGGNLVSPRDYRQQVTVWYFSREW